MQNYQGDVSIIKIEKVGKEVRFESMKNGFIVAEGEISGHNHSLVAEPKTLVEIAKDENGFYLKVTGGSVKMNHQEHATQTIGEGLYFIGRQYEYNEVEERRVLD
jgi:hypothetical protein